MRVIYKKSKGGFMKRLIIFLIGLSLALIPSGVRAEEIIRYTMKHEIEQQEKTFVPTTEEMQEWWSIDLPRDENGGMLYTLEFDTSKVDFTKPGDYTVVLTFYKTVDHKYQKSFELKVVKPEEPDKLIGDIEIRYLKQMGAVFGIGIGFYVVVLFLLNRTSKTKRYVIVYDNKILKVLKSKEVLDGDQISKKLKLESVSSCIIMNKVDIPKYLEEMTKKISKFDYVVELKH